MHVETHCSREDLERRIRSAKQSRLRQRLRIVYWASCGETAESIVERVGLSRRRVQDWVARYNADGVNGLQDRPGRGRKLPLDEQQAEQLKKHLDEGPNDSDGICVFTAPANCIRWRATDSTSSRVPTTCGTSVRSTVESLVP